MSLPTFVDVPLQTCSTPPLKQSCSRGTICPTSAMDFGNLMETILNLRGKNTATVKVGLWCKNVLRECRTGVLWGPRARRSKVSASSSHFCTRTSRSNLVLSRQEWMDRLSCSKRFPAWINLTDRKMPRNVIKCPWLPLIETSMFILWWVSTATIVFWWLRF